MTHKNAMTLALNSLIESGSLTGPNAKVARKRSQVESGAYADVALLNGDTVADAVLDEIVMPIVFEEPERWDGLS